MMEYGRDFTSHKEELKHNGDRSKCRNDYFQERSNEAELVIKHSADRMYHDKSETPNPIIFAEKSVT